MKHKPKLGQHLLTDKRLLEHLVALCQINPNSTLIEIGPGKGALTQFLVHQSPDVHLIELDQAFFNNLQTRYANWSVNIHHIDILKFNWSTIPSDKLHIVGNLPYYISSPILLQMIALRERIHQLNFMLQLEVAQRLVAQPGNKSYGRLSILIQTFFTSTILMELSENLFTPPPKVRSAFIEMSPIEPLLPNQAITMLETITQHAFGQRRKKIRNALQQLLIDEDWEKLAIENDQRAGDLSVDDYHRICRYLLEKQSSNRI
ncbi:MAG: hypothetical protein CMF46_02675 [Legionellales bacterium]|nr:hypothetical protein [Legionellales bacterium]|tara:strand:+ start:5462 stop:6244 length:783 start_codon:yes stop_codon:yes gene_type:complete